MKIFNLKQTQIPTAVSINSFLHTYVLSSIIRKIRETSGIQLAVSVLIMIAINFFI